MGIWMRKSWKRQWGILQLAMTSHSWENHKVIWKIFQFQYSFHTFETSIYIYDITIYVLLKFGKQKNNLWKSSNKKNNLWKSSAFWFPTRDFLNWVAITTSQRQWLHDDLCGVTLAAVHRLCARRWRNGDGWDGPCWRLWSDVVNLCQSRAPFQFRRCLSGKKWKKYGVCLKLTKRYQPAKITVWERVPLGIRASTREPVPVRCQILQHQCPGRC